MISADIPVILKLYMKLWIHTALWDILTRFNFVSMNINKPGMLKIVARHFFSHFLAICVINQDMIRNTILMMPNKAEPLRFPTVTSMYVFIGMREKATLREKSVLNMSMTTV